VRAEDPAAVAARQEILENYRILKGTVDNLTEAQAALSKRIQSLERENAELRSQLNKPSPSYASAEDLKRLADTIKEVDKKREADNKLILEKIGNLGKGLSRASSRTREPVINDEPPTAAADPNQPTFTYVVKDGDYLSTIAQAYREKGVKVSVEQILKANPGLKANLLVPRMKILIPDTRAPESRTDLHP